MKASSQDDLFRPDILRDPYAYFGQVRAENPVQWNEPLGLWLITRYHHVVEVLRHPECFSNKVSLNGVAARDASMPVGRDEKIKAFFGSWFSEFDVPVHTTMRLVTLARSVQWRDRADVR